MKTRLQLQGELQRANSNAPKVYKNALDVFQKTWRTEGIKGLQRGLFPAVSGVSCLCWRSIEVTRYRNVELWERARV